ncbi:MAG: SOS response-associated peptidase [Dechloromonas sp.]|nr:SOS response-associated peptidase [Dechloromonas sp.]
MCAHYDPQTDPARLKAHFGVSDLPLGLKPSLWPGYHGPFLRRHEFADVGDEAVPFRELLVGSFGLIPHWAKDTTIARHTYNARSETVHECRRTELADPLCAERIDPHPRGFSRRKNAHICVGIF